MKHLINSFVAAVFTFGVGTTSASAGNELDSNNNANASNVPMGSEGSTNTSYGRGALSKSTGYSNTAIGRAALHKNTTGYGNTASGYQALHFNTKGWWNTASGAGALWRNTTGGNNTASGNLALYFNTTGHTNTASGRAALYFNTTGHTNTASGRSALYFNTTGKYNTVLGSLAGYKNKTGSSNVFIGYKAGYSEKGNSKLYIDNSDTKKPLVYGDFLKNTLKVNGRMYATKFIKSSDVRLKTDIRPLNNALDMVLSLQGKQYRLIDEAVNQTDIGLIAQDVEKVLPQIVSQTEDGYKAIDYQSLTAVLIEAMKEQQGQIMILEKENSELKALVSGQMEKLLARVAMLEGSALAEN
jgi:trimeric autotransporter adhesin